MNARERFQRIMRFEPVDRLPLWQEEELLEGTVREWIRQGELPLGISGRDVLAMDPKLVIKVDTDPLPSFVTRTIEEDDEFRTSMDAYGFTVRTAKKQTVPPTNYYYLKGSVANRNDWEQLKARYDAADPRRKPRSWGPELFDYHRGFPGPIGLRMDWGPGRGIKNGYCLGTERFLEIVADEPAILEEMFEFWAEFLIAAAAPYVEHCRLDYVFFCEDGMGFKHSTLVSPDTFRRIWVPCLERVVGFMHRNDIRLIGYYGSGNVEPLIPVLLNTGINLVFPLECAAGMDAVALRRRFGRDLRMIGNISRQALMDGPAAVEKEFRRKVPSLAAEGGYIPAVDDSIMPDIPLESYVGYAELVREFQL